MATIECQDPDRAPVANFLRSRGFVMALLAVVACACGLYAGSILLAPAPTRVPGMLWPEGKALTDFSLTDHRGRELGREALRGKWTMLFFGYTSCPDICPATLSALSGARSRLANGPLGADDVSIAFVSVDPTRDTPDRLASWAEFFGEGIVAATGGDDALQQLTTQLGVMYERESPRADGHYLVNHSSSALLIDPDVRLVAILPTPHEPASIANRVDAIRVQARGG